MPVPGPVPFRQLIEQAYVEVLLPFNGWISERSFRMALNGIPKEWLWSALSPTEDAFWEVGTLRRHSLLTRSPDPISLSNASLVAACRIALGG